MFALIKYGVGCTLSIKHTLLDWSRKLWFEYWWPQFILFIIMFLHGRACALVSDGDAGRMQARCFRSGGTWWRALGGRPSFARFCWFCSLAAARVSLARFRWFRAHFCHRALAAAQTNFPARFYPGALPSLLAYLTMQRSSFICCAQLFCRLLWSTRHTLQTGCF